MLDNLAAQAIVWLVVLGTPIVLGIILDLGWAAIRSRSIRCGIPAQRAMRACTCAACSLLQPGPFGRSPSPARCTTMTPRP